MRIFLNTGREISLVSLQQSQTYYGALCGFPYRMLNARKVSEVLAEARKLCLKEQAPYLVPPVIEPISLPPVHPASMKAIQAKTRMTAEQYVEFRAGWHHERLPAVTCIGVFDSVGLNSSDSEPYSSMTIVWFQKEFALPIDDGVLSQIRRRDWDSLAK